MRRSRLSTILSLALSLSVSACGRVSDEWFKTSEKDSSKSDKKKDGRPLVVGYWTGIFQERGPDGKLLEPVPVEMELTRESGFRLVFSAKPGVYVNGDYREFATRQTLLLTVRQSTFSLVGSPGRLVDMKYRVEGTEMTLSGASGEYTLARVADPTDPGVDPAKTVAGAWRCRDAYGNRWSLRVDLRRERFDAWVSSGGKPLWIKGSALADGNAYLLIARESNNASVVDSRLSVSLVKGGRLFVQPRDSEARPFECRR